MVFRKTGHTNATTPYVVVLGLRCIRSTSARLFSVATGRMPARLSLSCLVILIDSLCTWQRGAVAGIGFPFSALEDISKIAIHTRREDSELIEGGLITAA